MEERSRFCSHYEVRIVDDMSFPDEEEEGGSTAAAAAAAAEIHLPAEIDWEMLDKWRFFFLGAALFSGVSAALYPAVVLKTRLQVSHQTASSRPSLSTASEILRREGPRGFYRGFATSLAGTIPARALYMAALEATKSAVGTATVRLGVSEPAAAVAASAAAGVSAAVAAQVVWTPIDVISQRLMVQGGSAGGAAARYRGGIDAFRKILRVDGLCGLYRGFGMSILTYAPSNAVWWASYSVAQRLIWSGIGYHIGSEGGAVKPDYGTVAAVQGMSAAVAGGASAVITMPLDTIKTRMQVMDGGEDGRMTVGRTVRQLLREGGWGACFRGLGPRLALALLLTLGSLLGFASSSPEIRFLSAERRIDVSSPIARVFLTLKVQNAGTSEASQVLLAFSPTEADHLAVLTASAAEGKKKKITYVPLSVKPTKSPDAPNGAKLFSVSLKNPLKSGESKVLEVLYIVTHVLEPFPAEISQSESQLVYYRDSASILSPYHIVEQTTYVKTPSNKVESFTRVVPTNRGGTELKYGPYNDLSPYSYSPIVVHFENNNPFAVVEELVREIEISHWGNIQVTDHYKLKHAGAQHKGVFSRVEYQARPSISGVASFKHLIAKLPPRVHSVYYRDEIGNISSSHLRIASQQSVLEIEPRYPLFGGWLATFTIGYGLPLEDFVFESTDGLRYLNFSFGCSFHETIIDDLTVKVILPEGSKNPSAVVPYPVEEHLETSYSYLDVVGRNTLVLRKRNVVPEHNAPFQVYYSFKPIFMLAEPLMLISAAFLFFIACIAYLHIDLSIGKSS